MAFQILTTTAASITELKRDPMGTFNAGDGAPVAILNRNEPASTVCLRHFMLILWIFLRMKNSVVLSMSVRMNASLRSTLMTYKLAFNESALKEWKKLGHTIQEQFKKKLRERLENPRVPASQLHGRKDQYKIKLRGAGYRLVYSVEDEIITVTVIGVGKRENDAVYKMTRHRS